MIKIAKELNKVISGLEYSGRYVEARKLHDVFIKLSQIPPGVGAGMVAGNAGANVGTGMVAGNANNDRSHFQRMIQYYKDSLTRELKTTNNANTPTTSGFYKSLMQGSSLTEPEKLAFRAQAYRIRTEVRNQMYGMGDTSKVGNQGNINLIVENAVKVSGLYNERNFVNLDRYFPLIMSSIEQQILQRISPNEVPKYLQSAKALVGTYVNRQKAVLQNSAMQPNTMQPNTMQPNVMQPNVMQPR
jgi:hypothetical protein